MTDSRVISLMRDEKIRISEVIAGTKEEAAKVIAEFLFDQNAIGERKTPDGVTVFRAFILMPETMERDR